MSTASPAPFPSSGQRGLSPKEQMQRLKALACTLPQTARPACSGQLHVAVFFDGTGNNMKLDYEQSPPEKRKHSNIVKLYLTCKDSASEGYFRFYVPGVGTPFKEINDSGQYLFGINRGAAMAEKGEHRIIWAFTRLLNAPHRYVTGAPLIDDDLASTIVGNIASSTTPAAMRRVVLRTWQDKLQAVLEGRQPQVAQINLSVFGFSRGAAKARAFVNWLFEVCTPEGGGWTFAGIPIRCQFLGIFDTVASVGLANLNDTGVLAGHQSWADNSLEIHPAVEQCVHYVAGHEVRACFPLDSVRVKARYPANASEVMYPGAHSDVGGGYAPNDLGVSPSQGTAISIIPGVRMYHEARKAGVHLLPWQELRNIFQADLTPAESTINDFNAYLKDAALGAAPVERLHQQHMALYHSYRFKVRQRYTSSAPCLVASPADQRFMAKTQGDLITRLGHLGEGNPMAEGFNPARAAQASRARRQAARSQLDHKDRQLLAVAEHIDVNKVTPAVEAFLSRYVHDSMAGFMHQSMDEFKLNGLGLVKFRTVFKGND
jgi:Uncharacterized alpha/beta hydrolase domain (DUF2235)